MSPKLIAALLMMLIPAGAALAAQDDMITLRCSGTARNETLPAFRSKSLVDPAEVQISIKPSTDSVLISSGKPVSVLTYSIAQLDTSLIVFQSEHHIGFILRETGMVHVNQNIAGNPGDALFELLCRPVKMMF